MSLYDVRKYCSWVSLTRHLKAYLSILPALSATSQPTITNTLETHTIFHSSSLTCRSAQPFHFTNVPSCHHYTCHHYLKSTPCQNCCKVRRTHAQANITLLHQPFIHTRSIEPHLFTQNNHMIWYSIINHIFTTTPAMHTLFIIHPSNHCSTPPINIVRCRWSLFNHVTFTTCRIINHPNHSLIQSVTMQTYYAFLSEILGGVSFNKQK